MVVQALRTKPLRMVWVAILYMGFMPRGARYMRLHWKGYRHVLAFPVLQQHLPKQLVLVVVMFGMVQLTQQVEQKHLQPPMQRDVIVR